MKPLYRRVRLTLQLALARTKLLLGLTVLMVAGTAFAQVAPPPGPTGILATIEHYVLYALGAGAGGLLFKFLFGFLDSYDQRVQNDAAQPGAGALTLAKARILHLVDVIAHGLVAKLEPELRAQAAAGQLDVKVLLKDAMGELKQQLLQEHKDELVGLLKIAADALWPYLEHLMASRLHVAMSSLPAPVIAAAAEKALAPAVAKAAGLPGNVAQPAAASPG